jgi:hypothetical protein
MSGPRIRSIAALMAAAAVGALPAGTGNKQAAPLFRTSDRCVACHNGMATKSGQDVSIGVAWRATMMANSSRDPYWLAAVRRETIDHAPAREIIEDECSICHMPITTYAARRAGHPGTIFEHMPLDTGKEQGRQAADAVSCSVCHQIGAAKLGTRESFNGGFAIDDPPSPNVRLEYGPFEVDRGHVRIMRSSTSGFQPEAKSEHIRRSEICATCHTLYTQALDKEGKVVGSIAEQVPYPEWLHSDYRTTRTCQDCHMPAVTEPAPITRVFGVLRDGVKRHDFVAANFFMQRMLNRFRDDLAVEAPPQELEAAANDTVTYLREKAARLSIASVAATATALSAEVTVENLSGHKLPSAYPSRRAWLHFTVRDGAGRVVFESGAPRPDGSIAGNDNDADPARFEPHYTEITTPEQVQIYEDIMGDPSGKVTTGILAGSQYLKDNRLLPHGFDKATASKDIAVIGEAAADPAFTGAGHRLRYTVPLANASGRFRVEVELWYQPIGYRWATNLKAYASHAEPKRFNGYYDAMSNASAVLIARTSAQ